MQKIKNASNVPSSSSRRWRHPIRLVTAASLFDGHDAAINIMRRILQSHGAEVIHLGHNRSVQEIVDCAIQEDVQGIAITSYQGGHIEFFKYMHDLVKERGANIKIFGGGGGTILPSEIEALHAYGIARIYSPDDGRKMGLEGMIVDLLSQCDFATVEKFEPQRVKGLSPASFSDLAQVITLLENSESSAAEIENQVAARLKASAKKTPVLGITGTGGAGKSSLVDELVRRFLRDFPDKHLAILSVDPSKRKTGGALLGDRIRMNAIHQPHVYMRSFATRQAHLALSKHVGPAVELCKAAGFDLVIVETSGIGQSDSEIIELCDVSLYVMTPEYGAATQLEKIDMIDFADFIAINKFDKRGALDAIRDVKKQYRRSRNLFSAEDSALPVVGTIASIFHDPGTDLLYRRIVDGIAQKTQAQLHSQFQVSNPDLHRHAIVPPQRERYLAEIAESHDEYRAWVEAQAALAEKLYQLHGAKAVLQGQAGSEALCSKIQETFSSVQKQLDPNCWDLIEHWPKTQAYFQKEKFSYEVRGKTIEVDLVTKSLSGLNLRKVSLPKYSSWGDLLRWLLLENIPGEFPFTAGVFPLKRQGEDPARMFAGEGGPERTNRRFHYVSKGLPAKRLSTAFDSVTLYGEDPHERPDIFGKVGNSGVSIATVDDAKKLYSGFDLCDPKTSVSMTINGPAPMLLSFFFNAAIDQACERHIREAGLTDKVQAQIQQLYKTRGLSVPTYQGELPTGNDGLGLMLLGVSGDEVLPRETYLKIKSDALSRVRGTVQADILKEDQAQNTCIFSTEFALRMMGDVQQYFIDHAVRNFYSVSISGYHIAEAGANPITQVAFTLANGFTYVEYYLSRGMKIDDFAPNLSFFFSNGMDPEYAVIGRVARRIWARAMKQRYGGNDRSQKLKYHIQTSGRSLHAQEISFNDIRTTLQALYAIYDNCNSLHTNAYDEAITTPTEESVRRALAIQLIINRELGLAKNENPLQGAFVIDELTDLVEQAVLTEFRRISERGGVLGAMERMYQRTRIQEESLYYETLKHTGELPIIGVNTFLDEKGSPTTLPQEVIRANDPEKKYAIQSVEAFKQRNVERAPGCLKELQKQALTQGNLFEHLMEASKICSLGQISAALYEVGGQYRRNM
jgi:isobutyryl-CoA mutase